MATTKIHRTNSGDWRDLVACIALGEHPGDDHQMHKILEANYPHRNDKQLNADIDLVIPDIPTRTITPIVPWTEVTT